MKKTKKHAAPKTKAKPTRSKPAGKTKKRSIFDLPIPKSVDWKADWDDDGGDFSDDN
jgi:hypothetical protein